MLRLLVEALLMAVVLALQIGGLLLQAVPWLLGALRFVALLIYRLTYLGCALVISWLQPVGATIGIDPSATPWRMGLCAVLVTPVGLFMLWLIGWQITVLAAAGLVIYGACVGGIWDQLGPPAGLTLGV